MNVWLQIWGRIRAHWRGGLPLRSTMMLVIVLGVTAPALLLLAAEQKLTEKAQRTQQEYAEKALMGMGGLSLSDPIWVVDRSAINAVASHLLETPQVIAVRVEERLSSAPARVRWTNAHPPELRSPAEFPTGGLRQR